MDFLKVMLKEVKTMYGSAVRGVVFPDTQYLAVLCPGCLGHSCGRAAPLSPGPHPGQLPDVRGGTSGC